MVTLGNLLAGCLAIEQFLDHAWMTGSALIGCALALDFLDGLVARGLGVTSEVGKELDSLADIVSFGVAPAFLVKDLFYFANIRLAHIGEPQLFSGLGYLAFIIPLLSAVRLALFNLDRSQEKHFRGLPTPAHAVFWAGIPLVFLEITGGPWDPSRVLTLGIAGESPGFLLSLLLHPLFYAIGPILSSLLMILPLSMFSLKIRALTWKNNERAWIFTGLALLGFILFHFAGFSAAVLLYIVTALIPFPR